MSKNNGINKSTLSREVADRTGLTLQKAGEVVNAIFSPVEGEGIIASNLAQGRSVAVHGFGVFEVMERSERNGTNPATGEPIVIEGRNVVKFRPGKPLKEAVRG